MSKRKYIIFVIVVLTAVVVGAEVGFRYFFNSRSKGSTLEVRTLGAYQRQPWAGQYFEDSLDFAEQVRGESVYERYVMHDLKYTCATQYVNYDGEERTRKTWNPSSLPRDAAV